MFVDYHQQLFFVFGYYFLKLRICSKTIDYFEFKCYIIGVRRNYIKIQSLHVEQTYKKGVTIMENNEIIFEEEQDNRFENVTISDEYKGNMDMDDENPWFLVAANTGVA